MCRHGSTMLAMVTDKAVVYSIAIVEDVVCVDMEEQG